MNKRDRKAAYLATVTGIRDNLEALNAAGTLPASGPDWDDLVWSRSEVRRLEAELAAFDRAKPAARQSTPRTRGRPVTAAAIKEGNAIFQAAARRHGFKPAMSLEESGAFALMRMSLGLGGARIGMPFGPDAVAGSRLGRNLHLLQKMVAK